jgi:hypothetical protein
MSVNDRKATFYCNFMEQNKSEYTYRNRIRKNKILNNQIQLMVSVIDIATFYYDSLEQNRSKHTLVPNLILTFHNNNTINVYAII